MLIAATLHDLSEDERNLTLRMINTSDQELVVPAGVVIGKYVPIEKIQPGKIHLLYTYCSLILCDYMTLCDYMAVDYMTYSHK